MKPASIDFAFTELTRAEAVAKCKSLAAQNHDWHFHALPPGCVFSPRPDVYCFVVEDTDDGRTWCVFSPDPFTAECQELVKLLHGDVILDTAHSTNDVASIPIVKSVAEAFAKKEAWHHHMMKPGCVLSPEPTKHVITIEREGRTDIETHIADGAPDDVLREIELMYFKQHS